MEEPKSSKDIETLPVAVAMEVVDPRSMRDVPRSPKRSQRPPSPQNSPPREPRYRSNSLEKVTCAF